MQDVVVGVPTIISFQGLNRISGDSKAGARISIKRNSDSLWWDGEDWGASITYISMDHIGYGAHEYEMTYPSSGEYTLVFTHLDGYMVNDSYTVTVHSDERLTEEVVGNTLRGQGADEGTVTVLVDDVPVADADVWITTDEDGENVVAGTLQTSSIGKVTFWLDGGLTYYVWVQKDGKNFDNPNEVVW